MKITRCRLNKNTQNCILELFILEVTARSVTDILGIQPNSVALFHRKICQVIVFHLALEVAEVFNSEVEIDESYIGGVRKGKRGRGAAGKVVVFGVQKRHDKVFTIVVENTKTKTLMNEIALKIKPDSVVNSDAFHSYNALDVSEFHHHRINNSDVFVDEKNHINGIENFCSQAKRVLMEYNGMIRSISIYS